MNCEKYKAQIEEQLGREALPIDVMRHIEACASCRIFGGERKKLREMLDCLPAVDAPSDFNFRLKGRMKRAEQPVSVWRWQRLAGAGTATLAALAIGFVVLNNPSVETNTAVVNPQPIVEQPKQSSVVAEVKPADTSVSASTEDEEKDSPVSILRPKITPRGTEIVRRVLPNRTHPKNADEEIRAKDSQISSVEKALDNDTPLITPKGIPNPLAEPKKQDAGEILRTLGVETEAASEGLRVTKSNRVDLKNGDIIQKVNGENPAAVSGTVLNEIRLTVRRQDQTKEVKILSKPSN